MGELVFRAVTHKDSTEGRVTSHGVKITVTSGDDKLQAATEIARRALEIDSPVLVSQDDTLNVFVFEAPIAEEHA